jgi:hypothetical protein
MLADYSARYEAPMHMHFIEGMICKPPSRGTGEVVFLALGCVAQQTRPVAVS